MATGQCLDVGDELPVPSQGELRRDPLLARRQAELLEADDLGPQRGLVGEVLEGRAPPQPERRPVGPGGRSGIARRPAPRLAHQGLEPGGVELLGGRVQHVASRVAFETIGAQGAAQAGDVALE